MNLIFAEYISRKSVVCQQLSCLPYCGICAIAMGYRQKDSYSLQWIIPFEPGFHLLDVNHLSRLRHRNDVALLLKLLPKGQGLLLFTVNEGNPFYAQIGFL